MGLEAANVSTFTDVNGLQNINRLADKDRDGAMKEMAKQFESVFLDLMLKTMREANAVFREGGMFDSSEMDFHQEMFDHQLALTLSSGRGIGLAEVFYRQLQENTEQAVDRIEQGLPLHESTSALIEPRRSAEPERSVESLGSRQSRSSAPPVSEVDADAPAVQDFSSSQEDFVSTLHPYAERAAKELGVSPSVLLAQAALETGWGKYVARDEQGKSSFNLFNIKADQRWDGDSVRVSTLEFRDGIANREVASFRRYGTVAESFADYVKFVKGQPRYQEALQTNSGEDFVRELHRAGYATDPEYANKVLRLMQSDAIQSAGNDLASTNPQG